MKFDFEISRGGCINGSFISVHAAFWTMVYPVYFSQVYLVKKRDSCKKI